ncbi:MAG: hypothetical protein H7838_12110, partial [Magnetococcus sp. DMHC-8]
LARFWEEEFGDLLVKGEFWCKNAQGEHFDTFYDYPILYRISPTISTAFFLRTESHPRAVALRRAGRSTPSERKWVPPT